MKLPYSIPMETMWHGAKSLAYRLGAECSCILHRILEWTKLQFFVHGFTKALMRPNTFSFPRTILQKLVLLQFILNFYRYSAAQSTDMQHIILFLNISNREINRRFRSIDIIVGNFARCQRKIIGALAISCAWIGLSSTSCCVTASSLSACGQFQTSVWKRRQWWEFWNKTIVFHHHPLVSVLGRF